MSFEKEEQRRSKSTLQFGKLITALYLGDHKVGDFTPRHDGRFIVQGSVNDANCQILIDSGSTCSLIHERLVKPNSFRKEKSTATTANNSTLEILGTLYANVKIRKTVQRIVLKVTRNMTHDCILGVDGMAEFDVRLQFNNKRKSMQIQSKSMQIQSTDAEEERQVIQSTDVMEQPVQHSWNPKEQTPQVNNVNRREQTSQADAKEKSNLTNDQQRQIDSLLNEFQELFGQVEVGCATEVEHSIRLPNSNSVYAKPYRIPLAKQEFIREEVFKMQKQGTIRPSTSAFAAPVVLVPKKDGNTRFCIDYTRLNANTVKDKFPMPRIDDLLDKAKDAKFFSTIDLTSGYWQIRMNENDREKTAFITPEGLYEFNVMPFGLCNAPATFQRYMNSVLSGIPGVVVYIDDLLVFGRTWLEHVSILRLVFERLRHHHLKLKEEKCCFGRPSVSFLGHVVSKNGLSPDPNKTKAIKTFPTPQNVKELRSFLGMVSYCGRYIKNFSGIAHPLYKLTRKYCPWEWRSCHEKAFTDLKDCLTKPPVLIHPDPKKPYTLYTDASMHACGAVLCQNDEFEEERIVSYASIQFSKSEQNYSTIEKEAAAVLWAMKHFRPYLHGARFKIRSDHAPLQWLMKQRNASGRLGRWQVALLECEGLEGIEYIKGEDNTIADTLSRIPQREEILTTSHYVNGLSVKTPEEMRIKQEGDPDFIKLRKNLQLKSKCWMYGDRIFLPTEYRKELLEKFHGDGIHFGVSKTTELMSYTLFWPEMRKDVTEKISNCDICKAAKGSRPKQAPLQALPTVSRPFQRIALDYAGPFSTSTLGNKYILVMVDHFSRFLRVFPVKEATAATSTEKTKQFFFEEGVCEEVLTDQGTHFLGKSFQSFLKANGVKHLKTSPQHPQCDGMAERHIRTIKELIRASLLSRSDFSTVGWEVKLNEIVAKLNSTIHPATGISPFAIARGRHPKNFGLDWLSTIGPVRQQNISWRKIVTRNEDTLSKGRERLSNQVLREFSAGEKVWLYNQKPNSLLPKWEGPYEIIRRTSPVNYEIATRNKNSVIHVDRIQKAAQIPETEIKFIPKTLGRPPSNFEGKE